MLELHPFWNADSIIRTLSHVNIDIGLEYKALSYTWDTDSTAGTGHDTKVITCSGREVQVKDSLFAALERLCSRGSLTDSLDRRYLYQSSR